MVSESFCQLSHQPLDESLYLSIPDKQLNSVIYLKEISDGIPDKLRIHILIDSDDVVRFYNELFDSFAKFGRPYLL